MSETDDILDHLDRTTAAREALDALRHSWPSSSPGSLAWHTARILRIQHYAEALAYNGYSPDDPCVRFIHQRMSSARAFMALATSLAMHMGDGSQSQPTS